MDVVHDPEEKGQAGFIHPLLLTPHFRGQLLQFCVHVHKETLVVCKHVLCYVVNIVVIVIIRIITIIFTVTIIITIIVVIIMTNDKAFWERGILGQLPTKLK